MSTVILKQDHAGKKKGESVSMPFVRAREAVKAGIAEYPQPAQGKPGLVELKPSDATVPKPFHDEVCRRHKLDLDQSAQRVKFLEDEVKRLADEVKKAADENKVLADKLAAANKGGDKK